MRVTSIVVLLTAVVAVAALATRDMPPGGALDAAGFPVKNTDLSRMFFDYWNSTAETEKVKTCEESGGECMLKKTAKKTCNGKVDKESKCDKKKKVCCISVDLYEVSFTSGGVAKASNSHSSGDYPPMKAFQGPGYWHSGAPYTVPRSLWFEFPEPIRVVKYSFTSRGGQSYIYTATDGPSKYIFWASNHYDCSDESQWTVLNEDNSGTPFKKSNEPKMEYIKNNHLYRCYGFKVTDVPGRSGIKPITIGNVHFYSIPA